MVCPVYKPMRLVEIFAVFCLFALLSFYQTVHAQPEQTGGRVLFILDASGSMWGRVEGKEKITVAREVMTSLIQELPDQIEVGLQTYGHRSKGDCNDIELMVPPEGGSKATVIDKIQSIMPQGKTPITKSFELAGKTLHASEEQTTVVLISDGKETCGGDPCELVRSLRERGINVRVHVVGFDVSKEERDQLVCIATAGKGKYFTADNADQLKEALTEVKQQIVAVAEPQKPEPEVEPGLKLQTVLAEGGDPLTKDLSYEVYQAKSDLSGKQGQRITYSYDATPTFKLTPGQYYVQVKHGSAQAAEIISIEEGQFVHKTLNLQAGYLRLQSIPAAGAESLKKDLKYLVYGAKKNLEGNRKQIAYSYDARPLFKLPAGQYYVTVQHGSATAASEVSITANELAENTLNLNVGYLRLQSLPAADAEPLKKDLKYLVYGAKKNLEGNRKQIAYSYDAMPLFKLPAGQYVITVQHGSATSSLEVSVAANELTESALNLKVGYLRLKSIPKENAEPLKKDLKYFVYGAKKDLEGNRKQIAYSYDAMPLFKLPTGQYYVTVKHGSATSTLEVSVAANELTESTIKLDIEP